MSGNDDNELIKIIQKVLSRDGEEVSVDSQSGLHGMSVFNIRRRPAGDPTWFVAEDGSTIYDWREKFDRQEQGTNPPFQFGEKVLVSGFVESDPDGAYKIRADADGRLADNFYIATVPRDDPLKEYVGMPLEVIVDVVDERKSDWRISNIQNYDARLVEVTSKPLVNPTHEQLQNLDRGKRVVVKGTFVSFGDSGQDIFLRSLGYPEGSSICGEDSKGYESNLSIRLPDGKIVKRTVHNPSGGYWDNSTFGSIETEEGRMISVLMPTGRVTFSGGVLECLTVGSSNASDRKNPETGDYVRMAAFADGSGELSIHWCNPCLLDEASPERQKRYDELRSFVATQVQEIDSSIGDTDYLSARNIIGESRTLELTKAELESIRKRTATIPELERPMQTPVSEHNGEGRRHFYVRSVDNAYGTRLESMIMDEFVDFARTAVTGELKQTGEPADTSYLFYIARDFGVDDQTRESLIIDCIDARLGRIRGKLYDHERDFDDSYNIDQGLKCLAGLGTESSANKVFDYLRNFVEGGDFHEIGWRDQDRSQRVETFVYPAVSAITSHFEDMPRDIVHREIPYLQHLISYLKEFADEPIAVDVLNSAIDYFQAEARE